MLAWIDYGMNEIRNIGASVIISGWKRSKKGRFWNWISQDASYEDEVTILQKLKVEYNLGFWGKTVLKRWMYINTLECVWKIWSSRKI